MTIFTPAELAYNRRQNRKAAMMLLLFGLSVATMTAMLLEGKAISERLHDALFYVEKV